MTMREFGLAEIPPSDDLEPIRMPGLRTVEEHADQLLRDLEPYGAVSEENEANVRRVLLRGVLEARDDQGDEDEYILEQIVERQRQRYRVPPLAEQLAGVREFFKTIFRRGP